MKKEYIIFAIVAIGIGLFVVSQYSSKPQPVAQQVPLPTTVTVSGSVSTAVSGTKPISIDFKSDVGKTSTVSVEGGSYTIPLDNQHGYSISVKYSQSLANTTLFVRSSDNCATLQLNETSDSLHYDISC
jgi:hypothetical protein